MSFFGSLIGNAAIAGNGIIGREIEHRQSIEQDKQRSTSALANSKSLADHNSELAHQKELLIQEMKAKSDERNAAIYLKAADAAPAAGDERRFQKFKADIGQTDATEDQLRTVFKNQYNQRVVGNFVEADRYTDPASANSQDIVSELRKNAAPATMIVSAQKDHQSLLDAERKATIDALSLRRQESKEADDKEGRHLEARRIEALAARGSGGSSSDTKEWLGVIGEQRKGLAAELADLRKTRDAKLEATPDPKKKQAIIAEFDTQIATAKRAGQAIDDKIEAVTSRLMSKAGAPKMDKPAGGADQSKQSKHLTQAEYNALPKGATFTNPKDGKQYKKQ